MSSGAECYFTEVKPGQWTYWLQDWPYGDNDEGQTYGPFRGFVAAEKDLHDNHQNPGGHSSNPLPEGQHVHEWTAGGQVKTGITVQIDVRSLGPDATPAEAIAFIQTLPTDHPAFKTWATWGYSETVQRCASCGQSPTKS